MSLNHQYFMSIACEEAKLSLPLDVPVGAVILNGQNEIIAKAHNRREEFQTIFAHAEVLALKAACTRQKSWHLKQCKIYVTLEPCLMCWGAIQQSQIETVIFGAYSRESILERLPNPNIKVWGGISEEQCQEMLLDFFKAKR